MIKIIVLFAVILLQDARAYRTYYIELIQSSNKISQTLYERVVTSMNRELTADGSRLTLRLRNISSPTEVYNHAYSLVNENVIALLDVSQDSLQTGCVISTVTGIPVFGLNDNQLYQMTKLEFCKQFIAMSADYTDYAHASKQILDTFQWKKVALVFQDKLFYQAAFFQSIVAKKEYAIKYLQIPSRSNHTIEVIAKDVFRQLAALDVDVILLYSNESFRTELLNEKPCNPSKSYVWILQENVPNSMMCHASHMVLKFRLPRNNTLVAKALQAGDVRYQDDVYLVSDSISIITKVLAQLRKQGSWLLSNWSSDVMQNRKLLYDQAKKVAFQGSTGNVQFYDSGKRTVGSFEIDNLRNNQFIKIGTWSKSSSKIQLDSDGEIKQNFEKPLTAKYLQGKKLSIVSRKIAPFYFVKVLSDGTFESSGFCIDLLKKLAKDLKFSYTIHEPYDGNYGSIANGQWDGMIRELIDGNADMAVSDLTVTEERASVVDFTVSTFYFTEDMAMRKEEIPKIGYLLFLEPFSTTVWTMVLVILVVFTIMLFGFNYFSPYSWNNEQDSGTSEEFSLFNCLWFSVACMLQQGADNTPKSPSGRVLVGFFWFYVLIWVSTYTANLAAYFTVNLDELPIKSFEDAINSSYDLGVSRKTHLAKFFNSSKIDLYQRAWKRMKKLPENETQGIEWARKSNYIHIGSGPNLEYLAGQKPCDLVIVPGLASPKSYAFALRKNNPYINELNLAILRLHDNGFIQKLRRKYWNVEKECITDISKLKYPRIGLNTVSLKSMAGVFIVLAVGFVFSLMILGFEICWSKRKSRDTGSGAGIRSEQRSTAKGEAIEIGQVNHAVKSN